MTCIDNEIYDFILSANNLDLTANPLKALQEFKRVLKKGGLIIIIVPTREKTFNHRRELTRFEHLLEDYKNDMKEDDLTHLPEILRLYDFELDDFFKDRETFERLAEFNYENKILRHHVFGKRCLTKIFRWLELEIINFYEIESSYMIAVKKK